MQHFVINQTGTVWIDCTKKQRVNLYEYD